MLERDSPYRKIVREEVEAFIKNLKTRFAESEDNDEGTSIMDEVRSALGKYMGASTAKVAVSFVRKLTPWNFFFQDNFANKVAELKAQENCEMGMASYVHGAKVN
jgi:7,8-dihydro-6-hydroxymethylpterin-pyrophosphokinase